MTDTTSPQTADAEPADLPSALIELRHARAEVERLRPFVDMADQAQRDAEAAAPPAADRAASYRLAADAIERMQGYPHLILPEEIVEGLRLLATGAQPEPGSPAYTRRLAAGERDEQQAQQDGAETRDALMRAHVALAAQAGRDQAALAKVRGWVASDVVTAVSGFGDGYREAQRDIRDLIGPRRVADEEQQAEPQADFTESVIYEVVGDWGVDSADSAAGAQAAVAKWLRAYPKCGAHAQQRIYRDWPDGSEYYGPWTDLPTPPAVVAEPGKESGRG